MLQLTPSCLPSQFRAVGSILFKAVSQHTPRLSLMGLLQVPIWSEC